MTKEIVFTNRVFAIYGAPIWLFGVVSSAIHLLWTKTLCGRLETPNSMKR
ncbi:type IIL restriction-modification enzyme MmeI [Xylanibacter brevis]